MTLINVHLTDICLRQKGIHLHQWYACPIAFWRLQVSFAPLHFENYMQVSFALTTFWKLQVSFAPYAQILQIILS
jgi:hypothetical protein